MQICFRTIFLSIALIIVATSHAQISYNGSFEYSGADKQPLKWFYQKSKAYDVKIDSATAYNGRASLKIISSATATKETSLTVFQTINLASFKSVHSIKVVYHVKMQPDSTQSLYAFLSPQQCTRKRKFNKSTFWKDTDPEGWKALHAEINDTLSCKEVFVGFIVAGIVDLNVDAIEIYINGAKIKDLPIKTAAPVVAQEEDVKWLKNTVLPIFNADNYEKLSDLSFLKKAIGNSVVVALGESTHGTREFNTLRGRIIQYLIDSLNFEIIVFENDIVPTHQVNTLLASSLSSRAILDSLFGRVHQTEEIALLFDRFRAKNEKEKKIIIEGCDMQGFYYATKQLLKRFQTEDTLLYQGLKDIENYSLSTKFTTGKYDTLYRKAMQLLELYQHRILQSSSPYLKGGFIAKSLETIRDAFYFNYIKYLPLNKGGNAVQTSKLRDSLMAENVLWLSKHYPGKKIILWAHNAHVKKGTYRYEGYKVLGGFLSDKLRSQYKTYGFTTARGVATGYGEFGLAGIYNLLEPTPDTYEYYLNKTGKEICFWNLHPSKKEMSDHITILSRLKLRSIGYNYTGGNQFTDTNVAESYDGLFYISNTTNARSFHFPPK